MSEFGHLDVLVNNAGILLMAPVEELSEEQWARVIGVNLTGQFLGIQAVTPELKKSKVGASIINLSSEAGMRSFEGMAAYSASKFGVRGLTKATALDLGKFGIRVNSIHPGTIRTPMIGDYDAGQPKIALQRIGQPGEVAPIVVYLASDESSFTSGAEIVIDGGEIAGNTN